MKLENETVSWNTCNEANESQWKTSQRQSLLDKNESSLDFAKNIISNESDEEILPHDTRLKKI
jgi:hypothetical protein